MNELIAQWKAEESIARIKGWDFSHINGRYIEETDFPWDYRACIEQYRRPHMKLLDIDTGGGEFLLSLRHPHENTAATEGYGPNVRLCADTLLPLGIQFREADATGTLPFPAESFHMVINRHGDLNAPEICRVLKPSGIFITQQVGADNDRELAELLLGSFEPPFPQARVHLAEESFRKAGFEILQAREHYGRIEFYDIGALVWFARIIEWEFPGFSVDTHKEKLLAAHRLLQEQGKLPAHTHRFLLIARKRP